MKWDVSKSDTLRTLSVSKFWHILFSFLAHSGDSWYWLAGLAVVWLFGNTEWHNLAAFLGIALVFESALVLGLKSIFRRKRPEGDWGEIYRGTHSFPSGHASRTAMLAVVAMAIGPEWFGYLLLFWAPLVSLARVVMGVHYLSDVISGMIIGAMIGWGVLQIYPWVILLPIIFR